MDRNALLAAIERDGSELVAAAGPVLGAPCPSCPAWKGADLLRHVGQVHRRFATAVERRATERPPSLDTPPDAQLPDWVSEGLDHLLEVLRDAEELPETWTWAGPRPVSWVVRRMAHETAVHRWDAEAIERRPQPLRPDLAPDCVAEYLEVFLPTFAPPYGGPPATLRLEAHDVRAAWAVDVGDITGQPASGPPGERRKAEALVRGTASQLALALWGRVDVETLDVRGDTSAVHGWWSWLAGVRR